MPEELPQLGKFVTVSFDAADTAYPVIACVQANKETGYVVPAQGSACPDPRYAASHVFTHVVPTSIDGRVWWHYQKLPGKAVTDYLLDKVRGPYTQTVQTIKASDVPIGGAQIPIESGGIVTEITYPSVEGNAYLAQKVTIAYTLAGAAAMAKTDQIYSPEDDTFELVTQTLKKASSITEGITLVTPGGGPKTITLIESKAVDQLMSMEISTTWTEPVAQDAGSQIVTFFDNLPYSFPAVMHNLDYWIVMGGEIGFSPTFTRRVRHTTYTYWDFRSGEPTVTVNGELSLAMTDSLLGNAQPLSDIIINGGDDYFVGGTTITITASTPDYDTYVSTYLGGGPRAIYGKARMDKNRYRWRVDRVFIQFVDQAHPVYTT